jgi:hypothetical protein
MERRTQRVENERKPKPKHWVFVAIHINLFLFVWWRDGERAGAGISDGALINFLMSLLIMHPLKY